MWSCFWYWSHLAISYIYEVYLYLVFKFKFYVLLLLWRICHFSSFSYKFGILWSPLRVTMSLILLWHPFFAQKKLTFCLTFIEFYFHDFRFFVWFLEVQHLFPTLMSIILYQLPFHDFILWVTCFPFIAHSHTWKNGPLHSRLPGSKGPGLKSWPPGCVENHGPSTKKTMTGLYIWG